MSWEAEYAEKTMTADEAFERFIRSGMRIYTSGLHVATQMVNGLIERVRDGRLTGIETWGNWMNGSFPFKDLDVSPDQFRYRTYFAGPNERNAFHGCVTHVPIHFSDVEELIAYSKPDYAFLQVTPPDENGMVNIGPLGFTAAALPHCKHLIAQVNPQLPWVYGDCHDYPVSAFDAFIPGEEALLDEELPEPTPEERGVAQWVVDRVPDGATIQIGIGGISNAIGEGLMSKQHLGCYTEMYLDVLARLQQKGIIDNSRKNFMPGVSVAGFTTGQKRAYDFIDHNPEVRFASFSDCCNPRVISQNDNLYSMNTAISVDLLGQVCAESIGPRQYSASGGQMNYVEGAKWSKGGHSFICVTSVQHTSKHGDVSKIVPTLAPGSAVTTLRNEVEYIATEYGVADLRFADIPERCRRLIAIAHPDFRDQLEFEAKKLGYLY